MDSPRRLRNRVACRRCQRRKIRCDGSLPSCGSCQKAGVPCVNDGKQEVHRSYIANMENRIKWLESIVREKCSEVDLAGGPDRDIRESQEEDAPAELPVQTSRALPAERSPNRERQDIPNPRSESSSHPAGPVNEVQQAHEIGLVSLSPGGDPRYIGPSSGYFFAKRILSSTGSRSKLRARPRTRPGPTNLSVDLLNTPVPLPPDKSICVELSDNYFQTIHPIYPFLHRPTHLAMIDRAYTSEEDPLVEFQVYMVLAISALNISRQCKFHLPVEGYYASAMKHVDFVCNHGSIAGLQCLLLIMVYALYNPSCNISVWNLNYQCLASVVDLGLQRDVRASAAANITVFDQEMRTRIFWVVYTFDRTVCTMMGRPIGLRDEACDLRFPMDTADEHLNAHHVSQPSNSPSHMSYSIHLFRLAQHNSEIKYIMHSVCRDMPAYAVPQVKDILTWQNDVRGSLHTWLSEIPQQSGDGDQTMRQICTIKYHETMILLLRPSPGAPNPTSDILNDCFHHARHLIKVFGDMYSAGTLLYSRLVVHSILLGTLFMLHCIWKLPDTLSKIRIEELILAFNISQNILSSIGEHWDEATRARDCLDELCSITVERLLKPQSKASGNTSHSALPELHHSFRAVGTGQPASTAGEVQMYLTQDNGTAGAWPADQQHDYLATENYLSLFDDLLQGDFASWGGMSDIDGLMWDLFRSSSS